MKVENNSNQYPVNNMADTYSRRNSQNDKEAADSLVDSGVSMEISQRGLALAGKWNRFWILMKLPAPCWKAQAI